jgi:hypothetical protein
MMHLLFSTTAEQFKVDAKRISTETGLWLWPSAATTGDPAVVRVELTVGRATLCHDPARIASVLSGFVA